MAKLNTYLNFNGNTEEAFNLYKSIFGGEFTQLVRFGDMPMEGVPLTDDAKNLIMHIGLPVGDNVLMATDAVESMGQNLVRGNDMYVSVHTDTREEADRVFGALSEGANVEMPIADQVWGDYFGSLIDRFGTRWMVNYGAPREG